MRRWLNRIARPAVAAPLTGALLFCSVIGTLRADERLLVDGQLEGRPVHLALDTGTGLSVAIWRATADALNLPTRRPTAEASAQVQIGQIAPSWTEPVRLEMMGAALPRAALAVIDTPNSIRPDADGLIGWSVLQHDIVVLQVARRVASIVGQLPAESLHWQRIALRPGGETLMLNVGNRADTHAQWAMVDTGSTEGVKLSPARWREWTAAHPNRASTMNAYYKPGSGLVVAEQSWATDLAIGDLMVHDVPVAEADATDLAAVGPDYVATLGLAALCRLDLVLDGSHGVAYARGAQSGPARFVHNRLGAVFVPRDAQSDDLCAAVADRSPAFAAGIRDGDLLLKIDQLDVTKFRTQPGILPLGRFWNQPAGTKLSLRLKRGANLVQIDVELRDILGIERLQEQAQ